MLDSCPESGIFFTPLISLLAHLLMTIGHIDFFLQGFLQHVVIVLDKEVMLIFSLVTHGLVTRDRLLLPLFLLL